MQLTAMLDIHRVTVIIKSPTDRLVFSGFSLWLKPAQSSHHLLYVSHEGDYLLNKNGINQTRTNVTQVINAKFFPHLIQITTSDFERVIDA